MTDLPVPLPPKVPVLDMPGLPDDYLPWGEQLGETPKQFHAFSHYLEMLSVRSIKRGGNIA